MKHPFTRLASRLWPLLAVLRTQAAPSGDFDQQAAALFTKTYSSHAWNETDHTVDGEDWSLPAWVKPAPYSGVQISEKRASKDFPARGYTGPDLQVRALKGDAVIRLVRVIKLRPLTGGPGDHLP